MNPNPAPPADAQHDLIILGGGLAGLTLALQLRQRLPDLDIQVLERRQHPVPEAAHKVGESTVEIGAHYFANVLGLKDHLSQAQLKKNGFRFFFSEGRRDFDAVTELGTSRPLPVGAWQIDRGIFENFLGQEVQRRGIGFSDEAMVRELTLADDGGAHTVRWQPAGGGLRSAKARWVVDASGRAGLIKKKCGLARDNAHAAHAVWFRINETLKPDEWSQDPAWQARCEKPIRWLSTNHLVGAGYWVWLIPLASGSHSIGIVADPAYHPLERMNTFERAMDWLQEFQPRLFDELDARRSKLQDFAFFRRFSFDCQQVLSDQRWALTGEAGRFLDPFYSPGSDFIAIGNTYITELVVRDRAGQPLRAHTQIYEQALRNFYDNTLTLYVGQYGIFGDPEVLPIKVFWDYAYYWGVLARLFMDTGVTDLRALSVLRDEVGGMQALNVAVQLHLRTLCSYSRKRNPAVLLDQSTLPWFVELNRALTDRGDGSNSGAFRSVLKHTRQRLLELATEIVERSETDFAGMDCQPLQAAIDAAGGARHAPERLLFATLTERETALV